MRVAFLTHEPFYPPSGGGSAEAIYLVQEFVRRGAELHVFCPKLRDPEHVRQRFGIQLRQFAAWKMGRYTAFRNFKYLLYPFFLERMVKEAARSVKFDLVLSQHSISAVAAGRIKRALGLPVVMNFLDYLTAFLETWPAYLAPPAMISALERFELSIPQRYRADAVLTVSDTLADYFAGAGYSRERIRPIYFGCDTKLFSPPAASGHQDAPRQPAVVMHGSLDHHHLGPIALNAIRHVAAARPETVFRFIGHQTQALEKFMRKVEKHAPQARIERTGFVPYEEVGRHLSAASVGMVPYEESKGVHCAFVAKIVECLAVGLPVVSTPLRSIAAYFKDEPMVSLAQFDGASMGERLLSWLNELPDRRQILGQAASQRIKAELDWQVICRKAIDWIESIQPLFAEHSVRTHPNNERQTAPKP